MALLNKVCRFDIIKQKIYPFLHVLMVNIWKYILDVVRMKEKENIY